MISKILGWIAKKTWGKKVVEWIDAGNKKVSGHRSEILTGIIALLWLAETLGVAPAGTWDRIYPWLAGALPVTMAEKISKAKATADKVIPKPE